MDFFYLNIPYIVYYILAHFLQYDKVNNIIKEKQNENSKFNKNKRIYSL